MNPNNDNRGLALALLAADTQEEVVQLLREAGYWNDRSAWRAYGDSEGNYSAIGNQQSRPEAALVEKIVNAVDARLLNECLERGIDPSGPQAPSTVRQAVSRFFRNGNGGSDDTGGDLSSWSPAEQLAESGEITLAVTGYTPTKGNPSITLADTGEGQEPRKVPSTFVSLGRNNKLRVPFVQGKFNMGGTGALKYCGHEGLQLIITRRNPKLDPTNPLWSFTVVRRERPLDGVGAVRNSVFTYLAPVAASEGDAGQLLTFEAEEIMAMPEDNDPYKRSMTSGSVLKLYEYDVGGSASHVLMKGGLLSRLELLLPSIALPVRIHECREYRGAKERSFANTLVGLAARLELNRGGNLEQGYPASISFTARGHHLRGQIYAFEAGKADSYRTNEGIIFTINGQTHGSIPKTFFERKAVKMGGLGRSLLVLVDCSELPADAREDLFMNSRDRLSNGSLRKVIEAQLEDVIGHHPGLRELREIRREREIEERLDDSKPLEDVLRSLLKHSPTLSRLFLAGQRLNKPFRRNRGGHTGDGQIELKEYPSFFNFSKTEAGKDLVRGCELGRKCRIRFDTDATNDYFDRPTLAGRYVVEVVDGPLEGMEVDHNLTLYNGVANWSISLPTDRVSVGDELTLVCSVTDDTQVRPFVNTVRLKVHARMDHPRGGNGRRGRGGGGFGKDQDESMEKGITLPDVIRVRQDDNTWREHGFTDRTACKVIEDSIGDDPDVEEASRYQFLVNCDNKALRTELKGTRTAAELVEAQFIYGNVLVGLALLHDRRTHGGETHEGETGVVSVFDEIDHLTSALAPFLVPMINYLGTLSLEDVAALAEAGDEE